MDYIAEQLRALAVPIDTLRGCLAPKSGEALASAEEEAGIAIANVFGGAPQNSTANGAYDLPPALLAEVVALDGAIDAFAFPYKGFAALRTGLGATMPYGFMPISGSAGVADRAFVWRLLLAALLTLAMSANSFVIVFFAVAIEAQRATVGNVISKFRVFGPWLDVIRFHVLAMFAALLTGVVVPSEYRFAPSLVFVATLCDSACCFAPLISRVGISPLKVRGGAPFFGSGAAFDAAQEALT